MNIPWQFIILIINIFVGIILGLVDKCTMRNKAINKRILNKDDFKELIKEESYIKIK